MKRLNKIGTVLIGLIDMTINLGTQELAFRKHNESANSQNKGDFKELAELLSRYDETFSNSLK